MGSRTLPSKCPHGSISDWGDFGPDPDDGSVGAETCERCEAMADRIQRLEFNRLLRASSIGDSAWIDCPRHGRTARDPDTDRCVECP